MCSGLKIYFLISFHCSGFILFVESILAIYKSSYISSLYVLSFIINDNEYLDNM